MSLSVIGAGIGRTGTFSLKAALEQIGYGPCYHMAEVFKHVDAHVPLWNAACEGHPDWDRIFQEYRSAVDFPVAAFYRELAQHYPDAKVILTIRDSSAVWLTSMTATIAPAMRGQVKDEFAAWKQMAKSLIHDRFFGGKMDDEASLVSRYEQHNDEVQKAIPKERLLVYNVSEGWNPLCAFLGVAVPAGPFPKTNSTKSFTEDLAPIFNKTAQQ